MRIAKLEIENFKGFQAKFTLEFKGNLIFLVGENNTCKTTVLEAFSFLWSGIPEKKSLDELKNKKASVGEHLIVTATLQGSIKDTIADFSEEKYSSYVFDQLGEETIILQRSSEHRTIKQKGKDVKLDVSKITLWNPETNQFENPAGFSAAIKTLFESQFVWSDMNPDDVVDFGPTKICGKLLSSIFSDFQKSDKWKAFEVQHRETFHGADSLGMKTKEIADKIKTVFESQYGSIGLKFDFPLPDATNFLKPTSILVTDNVETKLEDKGSGMQRAITLAILQVYAQNLITHAEDPNKIKPIFFFIDEPEISLHPKAQSQLLEALIRISGSQQIFITTHSPFLLKQYDHLVHDLFVFNKDSAHTLTISTSTTFKLFSRGPSWGEIVYKAFGIPTEEFHNELYGELQERENRPRINVPGKDSENIEKYFVDNGHQQSKVWLDNGVTKNETLMTYIRNRIHHPENSNRAMYSSSDLRLSIDSMITLLNP